MNWTDHIVVILEFFMECKYHLPYCYLSEMKPTRKTYVTDQIVFK